MKNSHVYDMITNRIIQKIEEGGAQFLMPFTRGDGDFRNAVSGASYRGINILMTGLLGEGDTVFATYKQWQQITGEDRPLVDGVNGLGVPIVYYKMMDKTDRETGEKNGTFPLIRYSTVFGASRVRPDLLPAKFHRDQSDSKVATIPEIEAFVENTDAIINRNGNKACYYPDRDTIEIPTGGLWLEADRYYPVMFHELVHWTKHESRCARKQCKKWGDRDYAFEELIAELGSAYLCRTLGLHTEVRDDHAGYIDSWLKAMKGDSKYIFDAAKLAQDAVDYLHGLQPQVQEKAA